MLKTEIYLVLGLVFVCVGAQQRPPIRPPRPPSVSGSYSDYPGLLVNANPSQSNRPKNVQNNNLRANIPKESSSSNVDRTNSGPIVIPAASSSYSSLPSQEPPQSALPSRTTSYSDSPKSAQGIPVSVVAAAELAQQYEKPVAPVKTGTDTWTPMGFTGDGKSFDMPTTAIPAQVKNKPVEVAPSATAQPVPYDSTKSQQTIGQQIIERQQKQQQQQQYDIFGFPIDNSPGILQSEALQNPDPFEVIVNTIEMQIAPNRRRRHAVRNDANGIIEPSKKFYPPKPPKDLPMPAPRRRPPPPPPLSEEMYLNQHETVQPKTNTQPRYSGVSKTPSKAVDTKPTKYDLKPSPVTTSTTTINPAPKITAVETTVKQVSKLKAEVTTKTNVTPKPPVTPKKPKKPKAKPYVKTESVNQEQNGANALEAGESPKEALNAEAGLELQALIGSTNAANYHGHSHDHATHDHSHTHAHTHQEPPKPKPAKNKKGPPPEMQAKFSSMFNAWYNAKFGDAQSQPTVATTVQPQYVAAKSEQTKQPSKVYTETRRPGPVTKSVDKNALFEEFMTMFQNQLNVGEIARPTTKYPVKVTTKPVKTKPATQTPPPTTTTTAAAPTTKAPQTKAIPSKTNSKASYEKSPNAKFGPRQKNDYLKPTKQTTPMYPQEQTTAPSVNDPTQVKLVTLSHPESLAYPSNEPTKTASGSNSNMTSPNGSATPPAQNTGANGMNTEVLTRSKPPYKNQVLTRGQQLGTTTVRPTLDPDLLNDINEARVMQGLPEVQAHQVDLQGNLLPFYKRQMRIGRLPARHHPLHNPGGIHHQLQHEHNVPHYHPEQGLGAAYNNFPNLFYSQPTNNGAVMAYEPYPRPNIPGPTTAAPNTHATESKTVNVAPLPLVDAGPLTPLAYFYFFSALNNLLHPQNNGGYLGLFRNGNGQGYDLYNPNSPNNGHMHGDLGGGHSSLDLHHQAIHREAGNAMTPNLHRQVHRLLRNRELSRQRGNMFGMQNFPTVTQTPFIDPDLYADMMEAQAAALAG